MMPCTSSTVRDASRTRCMVVLIEITILFLVSAGNVLPQYNDTTHTHRLELNRSQRLVQLKLVRVLDERRDCTGSSAGRARIQIV